MKSPCQLEFVTQPNDITVNSHGNCQAMNFGNSKVTINLLYDTSPNSVMTIDVIRDSPQRIYYGDFPVEVPNNVHERI